MPSDVLQCWKSGPLPSQDLEQIAFDIFQREYPERLWYEPTMKSQRDDCRRFALQLRAKFATADRWALSEAHERLGTQLGQLIFGTRALGKTVRQELTDYAEAFIADAWGHFRTRLFYPKDVDANAAEVANEAIEGRRS